MSILKPEKIEYIVVHCSATSPNSLIGAKEINDMHLARGWFEIGYHIVIRRNLGPLGGLIEYGRGFDIVGAHVKGYNDVSLGICMIGGVDGNGKPENNFIEDQFKALKKTLDFLTAIFPKAKVCGHRDFSGVNKACPCFNVSKWWLYNNQLPLPLEEPEPILADVFEW